MFGPPQARRMPTRDVQMKPQEFLAELAKYPVVRPANWQGEISNEK